jgi:hypothetical protein
MPLAPVPIQHTHLPSSPPAPLLTSLQLPPTRTDLLTPQASFDAISRRLLVGPVVRTLVYNKIPNTVCDWVDGMTAEWRFERIIPAHFSAPVRAGGCWLGGVGVRVWPALVV